VGREEKKKRESIAYLLLAHKERSAFDCAGRDVFHLGRLVSSLLLVLLLLFLCALAIRLLQPH
jgi:hypothetical protein